MCGSVGIHGCNLICRPGHGATYSRGTRPLDSETRAYSRRLADSVDRSSV